MNDNQCCVCCGDVFYLFSMPARSIETTIQGDATRPQQDEGGHQ